VDVTTIWGKAMKSKQELTTTRGDAIIVPCVPLEEVDPFADEEPTLRDIDQGPKL
jgi:hypothetical protein